MQIIEIQCKIFEKIFAQMEKSSEKSTEMSVGSSNNWIHQYPPF